MKLETGTRAEVIHKKAWRRHPGEIAWYKLQMWLDGEATKNWLKTKCRPVKH